MRKRVKDGMHTAGSILCIACYGGCGVIWLYKAFAQSRIFYVVLGCVWLAGAVIWAVCAAREFQKKAEETTDETNHV